MKTIRQLPPRGKKKKRIRLHRRSKLVISIILIMLASIIIFQGAQLKAQENVRLEQISNMEKQIQQEEERAADLEVRKEYLETDAFIEDIARDKLGLAYDNETLFVAE